MKIFKMIFLKRSRNYKVMQNVIFLVKLLSPTLRSMSCEVCTDLNQEVSLLSLKIMDNNSKRCIPMLNQFLVHFSDEFILGTRGEAKCTLAF